MGSFGINSCSNDDCWDCLVGSNIHNMTTKQGEKSLKNAWESNEDMNKLGVVIWLLWMNLFVPLDKMTQALVIAKVMRRKTVISEQEWKDKKGRHNAVRREIRLLERGIHEYFVSQ